MRRKINNTLHEVIAFDEMCTFLGISKATGNNWIRLGKITPDIEGHSFSRAYLEKVQDILSSQKSNLLKKRRNKKQASGLSFYSDYIEKSTNQTSIQQISHLAQAYNFKMQHIRLILANYALQLACKKLYPNGTFCEIILSKRNEHGFDNIEENIEENIKRDNDNPSCYLHSYINNMVDFGDMKLLIDDLCGSFEVSLLDEIPLHILNHTLEYIEGEDSLGLLYLSLCDASHKKSKGIYYTPFNIMEKLIFEIKHIDLSNLLILDPACGSGTFLTRLLKEGAQVRNIYGFDIDPVSVAIARINIAFAADITDYSFLFQNICCVDSLKTTSEVKFDLILGNPPWGYDFSSYDMQYLRENYETAKTNSIESHNMFIEYALKNLKEGGILAYVLPEAILNVQLHKSIRRYMLLHSSFLFVTYLDSLFSNVYCPSIILGLKKGSNKNQYCKVSIKDNTFNIDNFRKMSADVFNLNVTDKEYMCLESISSSKDKVFLKNNAIFAMGIVTGNNAKHIHTEIIEESEPIYKGNDIFRYRARPASNYIVFDASLFQQTAKIEYYRASQKLIYRFICNEPVFAYDDTQALCLNSCNILIPQIEGLDIKYVLAVLNSLTVSFFIKKSFNSVKLLRSHIEGIPIPYVDTTKQKEFIALVDQMINSDELSKSKKIYREIENKIMQAYNLSEQEISLILNSMPHNDKYLL